MVGNGSAEELMMSRHLLFADMPLNKCIATEENKAIQKLFASVKESIDNENVPRAIFILQNIVSLPNLASRQYLQAYYFINELQGYVAEDIKILGIVLELSVPHGHDIIAVYADHSAGYFSHSGKKAIWQRHEDMLDKKIDDLIQYSAKIITQLKPYKGERPDLPGKQIARINFLTSYGLHFGDAPQQLLFHDPGAGKIMFAMLDIAKAIIQKIDGI